MLPDEFEMHMRSLRESGYESILPSDFLVLHEACYRRYIRNEISPFTRYPSWDEIPHAKKKNFDRIKDLFKHRLGYKLLKKFEVRGLTPELILYKRLWGTYASFIGDTLVYSRSVS